MCPGLICAFNVVSAGFVCLWNGIYVTNMTELGNTASTETKALKAAGEL